MYGYLLKYMREQSGMSQTVLSKKVGIAQNSLSAFELDVREPRLEIVDRIADACDFELLLKDKNSDEVIPIKKQDK